eukprot:CAMPEP_0183299092 /NCGR_PEP_ID=MMETSP0160_2-20130417/5907_1 /TAXON_ID=2839 ORGANISM="Odontella Sinensis, Strain Grunow 1884" /NCGR_SAMPLE_ID=MMETSP0160_2 /ASSEMBLY_ACC=CAM_ASM_000250 /LENGTH=937 /DNA_ID=CAMNT_0025461261 /DNA_START=30 /DNA_END=2843 /DNA_ORIENTATION=+
MPSRMGFGDEAPKYPHLIGLPVTTRPLFPGVLSSVTLTDQPTIEALERLQGNGYVGVFLRKDSPSGVSENGLVLDAPELITDPDELYKVGTFAQIHRIQRGVGFGTGASSLHAHPTRQEWKNLSKSGGGGVNGNNGEGDTSDASDADGSFSDGEDDDDDGDGGDDATPASVLLYTHRRLNLESVRNLGPPIDVTVSHWDRLRHNPNGDSKLDDTLRALTNEVLSTIRDVAQLNPLFREHMQFFPNRIDPSDPFRLADFVAAVSSGKPDELQAVLEERDAEMRLHKALVLISKEREVSRLQQEISAKVEEKMSDAQRKYFLNEQLKSIKKELGMEKDDKEALITKYRKKLKDCVEVPEEAMGVIDSELEKLSTLEKNSTEFNVTRSYLDWLTAIPWGKTTDESFEIADARKILDRDHYGLDDVKDIILQFIAVGKLRGTVQGKILCLAGPPGVGKTSIASSVADALGRKFFRFSVGGLGDVSEIKGHRRTYVGAMPGKMVQCLKSTGTMNPLILIDEIDKLGRDYRGDPASALLEVLDPNQNDAFRDHFLDVPVDMSKVLFMCTANDLSTIPGPLLDRMEVISLSGYDLPEKIAIAEQYLVPKSMRESGLTVDEEEEEEETDVEREENEDSSSDTTKERDPTEGSSSSPESRSDDDDVVPESIAIENSALESLVRWYCREAGVRSLEKHINKITRKLALQVVAEKEGTELTEKTRRKSDSWTVTDENLDDYVGKPIFTSDRMYEKDPLPNGIVMGLAWTSLGGSALYIETQAIMRGTDPDGRPKGGGMLQTTGQLGEVMKESTQIAYTVARARLSQAEPGSGYFDDHDVHMHVPEGATPKDGPSAGVTMVTAMLSLALDRPVRNDLAMTGEISLTGKVLPVGGIKEKTMAARRAGIKCIIFPNENKRDFDELPDYLKEGIDVHFAGEYADVYKVAFGD